MKPADILLAISVAVVWGLAFVLSKELLRHISPTMLCVLRFGIAALPCFFVARPKVAWPLLFAIGICLFLFQFLMQAYGLAHGVPPGLMAVLVQMQALFTVALAAIFLDERPTRPQVIGISIAVVGLAMICSTIGYDFSLLTFALTMVSPVSFSIGNLLVRQTGDVPMFDLVSWISLLQVPPLLAVAFATEGPQAAIGSVLGLSGPMIAIALLIGLVSTSAGYWAWGRLLRSYTAAQVVPFALLVPFTAAVMSWLVFGDAIEPLRIAGMMVVVAGIAVMLLLGRKRNLPEIAS